MKKERAKLLNQLKPSKSYHSPSSDNLVCNVFLVNKKKEKVKKRKNHLVFSSKKKIPILIPLFHIERTDNDFSI